MVKLSLSFIVSLTLRNLNELIKINKFYPEVGSSYKQNFNEFKKLYLQDQNYDRIKIFLRFINLSPKY